ncbi:MAG TPA: response regulator [Blastocatellia bacterium]|nr:response regulator [Blastocatellia bacterium]
MVRKKILLVDDAETILMMERMILSKAYDLVTAKDGCEALDKAHAQRPDLILLDVVMPKMDGFEACKQIRASDPIKQTPIILVTTRGENHNIETGYRNGCNDYITKPFVSSELLAKVKKLIGD